MENDIKTIQTKILNNLERLDSAEAQEQIAEEVSRSNAISQLANTYIKSCNLIIRVEESKNDIRNKVSKVINNEE